MTVPRHTSYTASRLCISVKPQRGSILVQFSLFLGILVTILGIVDIGYMYYAKRDLQRIADQSAIEAAQNIEYRANADRDRCETAGNISIVNNWPIAIKRDDSATTVSCGNWNPAPTVHPASRYFGTNGELNAAHVIVQGTSPIILPGPWNRTITAEAVAKREAPLAEFSVGTKLVSAGCHQQLAMLVQLLKIAGVGDPCIIVGGYEGLVGTQISASGLLKALGLPLDASLTIADVNDLLTAKNISLGELLDTALTLGGHTEFLDLNTKLLNLLGTKLGIDAFNLEIPLGSSNNGPGIFTNIQAPDSMAASALDIRLNVLDIVTAAVGVGTSGRGISIPDLSVAIPGILPNLLQVKVGIIEPPSIGIGGVGATAYNAQIRLYADVNTSGGFLGSLLQLLGTQIKLPIFIDVARAKGTITDISCRVPRKESTAKIKVDASIAQACIGKVTGEPFSTRTPICDSIQNETLINVAGLVKINNKVNINALNASYISPDIKTGETWQTPGNSLDLGTTFSDLVTELLRLVGDLLANPGESTWTPAENSTAAQKMADYYLGIGSNSLGTLPTVKLGADGLLTTAPNGAYNTDVLIDRLSAAIDRTSQNNQNCLLLIILCSPKNEWRTWGNSVGRVDSGLLGLGILGPSYIGGGSCYSSANGIVSEFNTCIRNKLTEELMKAPTSSKPKNFLQILVNPILGILSNILTPLGNLLAGPILRDILGIELGINDVNLTSIGCGNAQLVY